LLCFSVSILAQSPTPPPRVEEDPNVITVNSRLVVVPVSVVDPAGNPVQGLGLQDFRIAEDNRQQTLESVGTADQVPLEIALLFDVSASKDSMFRFQQETAAKFLQDVLRPEDRATIFTVGQKPIIVQARDTAANSINAVRNIIPTKQQTAFYDSLRYAAEHLRTQTPEGRRRVIVI